MFCKIYFSTYQIAFANYDKNTMKFHVVLGQTYCCVQCYFVKTVTIYSLVYIDVLIVLLLYYRHRLQCWYHCLGKNIRYQDKSAAFCISGNADCRRLHHKHRQHNPTMMIINIVIIILICRWKIRVVGLLYLWPPNNKRGRRQSTVLCRWQTNKQTNKQVTNNLSHCGLVITFGLDWWCEYVPQPTCSSKRSEMGNLTEIRLTQTSAGSLPQCRRRDPYPSSLLWVCCQLWR